MVEAPEKIWACPRGKKCVVSFTTPSLEYNVEYVRSDLYAALEARLAERVKVKTLEWTRGWMNAEAQTEIGQYTITYRRDGSFEWGIGILKGWASSWDEAKAAAQADFDRRILSELVSHTRDANPVVSHETANVRDNLSALEAENARLREALDDVGNGCDGRVDRDALPCRIARRALTGGQADV